MADLNILFSCDRRVLAGLHVAAYSVLNCAGPEISRTHFFILSDAITEADIELLRQTLQSVGKPFTLSGRKLDTSALAAFPRFQGTLALYYRLLAPNYLEADRLIYLDVDIVCDVNLGELITMDLQGAAVGMVPEAPLAQCADEGLKRQLSGELGELTGNYFNGGVIVMDVAEWRRQKITERCLEYLANNYTDHYDQTALNYVLRQKVAVLNGKFNYRTNDRTGWPALRRPLGQIGRVLHFIDFPKPWDFMGEFLHPQYRLWRAVLGRTAMKHFRSWQATPGRKLPKTRKAWSSYKKTFKDYCLFTSYSRGWLKRVKGVS